MKSQYSIYEAKARLSEIIRIVKNKRKVVITERGVPVAEVVPYKAIGGKSLESRIKDLESRGALILAKRKPSSIRFLTSRPGAVKRFLAEDRD